MDYKLTVTPENARKFQQWLLDRGGLAVWKSIDLCNPGMSWTTPVLDADGQPMTKPSWRSASQPDEIITEAGEVGVVEYKEVNRFHVAVRLSGMQYVLTDASDRKVRKALDKAGEDATYEFDYWEQDAIILAPDKVTALPDWIEAHPLPAI